jgi:hypothetical protein
MDLVVIPTKAMLFSDKDSSRLADECKTAAMQQGAPAPTQSNAIGLHTNGMSVAQSEQLFLDGALLDPGNARQQALRGTYDPAYLNYTLGKLMILQLRGDWMKTHGGPKALKAFHDQFLSYGGPPLPMVRRLTLGADAGPAL